MLVVVTLLHGATCLMCVDGCGHLHPCARWFYVVCRIPKPPLPCTLLPLTTLPRPSLDEEAWTTVWIGAPQQAASAKARARLDSWAQAPPVRPGCWHAGNRSSSMECHPRLDPRRHTIQSRTTPQLHLSPSYGHGHSSTFELGGRRWRRLQEPHLGLMVRVPFQTSNTACILPPVWSFVFLSVVLGCICLPFPVLVVASFMGSMPPLPLCWPMLTRCLSRFRSCCDRIGSCHVVRRLPLQVQCAPPPCQHPHPAENAMRLALRLTPALAHALPLPPPPPPRNGQGARHVWFRSKTRLAALRDHRHAPVGCESWHSRATWAAFHPSCPVDDLVCPHLGGVGPAAQHTAIGCDLRTFQRGFVNVNGGLLWKAQETRQ